MAKGKRSGKKPNLCGKKPHLSSAKNSMFCCIGFLHKCVQHKCVRHKRVQHKCVRRAPGTPQ
eukprot:2913955-Prymnesium_polylepis.1